MASAAARSSIIRCGEHVEKAHRRGIGTDRPVAEHEAREIDREKAAPAELDREGVEHRGAGHDEKRVKPAR
jgi:hypothetical protein